METVTAYLCRTGVKPSEFAAKMGTTKQQVNRWINNPNAYTTGFVVYIQKASVLDEPSESGPFKVGLNSNGTGTVCPIKPNGDSVQVEECVELLNRCYDLIESSISILHGEGYYPATLRELTALYQDLYGDQNA